MGIALGWDEPLVHSRDCCWTYISQTPQWSSCLAIAGVDWYPSSEVASRALILERNWGSAQIPTVGNEEGLRAEPKVPASERQLGVQKQVLSFRGKEIKWGFSFWETIYWSLPWMNPHVPLHLLCESYQPMRCSAPSSCLNGTVRIRWYDGQITLLWDYSLEQ